MIKKNKYIIAVAIVMIATAFSACTSKAEEEIVALSEISIQDAPTSPNAENASVVVSGGNDAEANNDTSGNKSSKKSNSKSNEKANIELCDKSDNKSNKSSELDSMDIQTARDDTEPNSNDKKSRIIVYVCGAVIQAGVYDVKSGARVVDAIYKAGGMTEEAASEYINLAATVEDGQKIYIPTIREIEEAIGSGENESAYIYAKTGDIITNDANNSGNSKGSNTNSGGTNASNADTKQNELTININTASASELTQIPGIGESKAQKIIAYREENGGFSSIEDIMFIPGIKEGMFNKIKDYIRVE